MMSTPVAVRICGFTCVEEVRAVAHRHGEIVAPMTRDEDLTKLLKSWGVDEPIEY